MSTVIMLVVSALVFGIVIFVHELGHFLVAKKSGIKVNAFALGMGPPLLKKQWGETTYSLRLFPIGGYVQMEGEDEENDSERSFSKAPAINRLLVMVAGAFMNLLLGFLVLIVLIATGGPIADTTIVEITNPDTGLQVGDEILKINGRTMFILDDMMYEFARTQNGSFELQVRRDGEKIELENVAFPEVEAIDPETGEPVIDETTGEVFTYLDFGFKVQAVEKNVWTVVQEAFLNTLSYARMIYLSLFDLLMGRIAINQLSGPVGIVSQVGMAVSVGWQSVLNLLALISINLGIVNMLPLPALDGGKVLQLFIETVIRKPLNERFVFAVNIGGFVLLIGVMLFATFNDIARLVG